MHTVSYSEVFLTYLSLFTLCLSFFVSVEKDNIISYIDGPCATFLLVLSFLPYFAMSVFLSWGMGN